jgi:hypothetical protein
MGNFREAKKQSFACEGENVLHSSCTDKNLRKSYNEINLLELVISSKGRVGRAMRPHGR